MSDKSAKRKVVKPPSKKQKDQRVWRFRTGRISAARSNIYILCKELSVPCPIEFDHLVGKLFSENDKQARRNGVKIYKTKEEA